VDRREAERGDAPGETAAAAYLFMTILAALIVLASIHRDAVVLGQPFSTPRDRYPRR
jgi:hypothetical protein